MATYYLDFEGGNDTNNGTTFALRWKTLTSGATAARIAPGDEIRIMASPAPTLVGNATWNGTPKYGTGAGIAISSSTNATPIVITRAAPTAAAPEVQTGDWVFIQDHTTNTRANGMWKATRISATQFSLDGSVGNGVGGASGTFRITTNSVVELASAVTQNIACIGNRATLTNWSTAANVTATVVTTDYKQGGESQQIAIAAGFATGRAASVATGTLDLSAYQQVSFWIKQTAGTVATAGQITLRLCTDTGGVTSVHTISVPALGALNRWVPVTVDLGTNLNSAIASVALYVATDVGAQTFLLDNIIACKSVASADSLSLQSLIGKSSSGGGWYSIGALYGTTVVLENNTNSTHITGGRAGYGGTTETVSTYKRETIKIGIAATNTATVQTVQDSGTVGSPITFSGGWNRTDMSTQTGETYWDGLNGFGNFLTLTSRSNIILNKFSAVNFNTPFVHSGGTDLNITYNDCEFIGMSVGIQFNTSTSGFNFTNCRVNAAQGSIMAGDNINWDNCVFENIPTTPLGFYNGSTHTFNNCTFKTCNIVDNGAITFGSAVGRCDNHTFYGCTFQKSTAGIYAVMQEGCKFYDCTISDCYYGIRARTDHLIFRNTTFTNIGLQNVDFPLQSAQAQTYVYSEKEGGVFGSKIYSNIGQINTDSTTIQSASGISWRLTALAAASNNAPLRMKIAQIACRANKEVTFSAYLRRANAGSTVRLVLPKLQLSGIASDITQSMTAAINTWEEVTLTFTPTEEGVVAIFVETFGSTSDTWVDTISVSQAP